MSGAETRNPTPSPAINARKVQAARGSRAASFSSRRFVSSDIQMDNLDFDRCKYVREDDKSTFPTRWPRRKTMLRSKKIRVEGLHEDTLEPGGLRDGDDSR